MKRLAIIRPRAEEDLQNAKQWYDERREGLGTELVLAVRRAVHLLQRNPERYPIYYRDFRRALLRRFPYKLFYRIEGDCIIVFRILHTKQDHRLWLTE